MSVPTLGARRGLPHLPRHLRAKSWVTPWPLFLMGQVLTCRVTLSPREMSAGVRVLCSKALRAQVLRGLLQRSRYRGQGPGTPCCHSQARPPACWPSSPRAEFSELSFQPCLSVFKDPDSSLQGRHLGNAPTLLGRELFSFLSQTPMTAGQAQEGPAPGRRKQWRVPEDCGTGTWMAHRRPRDHRSEFRPSLRRPWLHGHLSPPPYRDFWENPLPHSLYPAPGARTIMALQSFQSSSRSPNDSSRR